MPEVPLTVASFESANANVARLESAEASELSIDHLRCDDILCLSASAAVSAYDPLELGASDALMLVRRPTAYEAHEMVTRRRAAELVLAEANSKGVVPSSAAAQKAADSLFRGAMVSAIGLLLAHVKLVLLCGSMHLSAHGTHTQGPEYSLKHSTSCTTSHRAAGPIPCVCHTRKHSVGGKHILTCSLWCRRTAAMNTW